MTASLVERTGLVLGIESSCDETSAAIVRRGRETLSNIVATQIAIHSPYGGVVPELASREHLRNIVPVVRAAVAEAGVTFRDLDAIAVTAGPGLAGALLVGITYAKSLAFALGKPLIAVNHLEGHIHAVLLEHAEASVPEKLDAPGQLCHPERSARRGVEGPAFPSANSGAPCLASATWVAEGPPILALVVSGGHTHLYLAEYSCHPQRSAQPSNSEAPQQICHPERAQRAEGPAFPSSVHKTWHYQNIGRTVDDAAGEAFDKVAKLLGLGYPGGPWIDALAPHGDLRAVPFAFSNIKAKVHRPGQRDHLPRFLFSFSGIKTAVLRYVETHKLRPSIERRRSALAAIAEATPTDALALCDAQTLDLIASFQHAVVGDLMRKTFRAAEAFGAHTILVSGGVAANRELRGRFNAEAAQRSLAIAFPSLALSTDNAAMIAAAAWPKFLAGDFAREDLSASASLALG